MTAVTDVDQSRSQALATHVDAFRTSLDEQRSFHIEQLAESASDGSGAAGGPDEVTGALNDGATRALAEIDAAIARIEDGTYGACQKCTKDIPVERLEVLPMTALCVRCAAQRDRLSR